MHRGCFLWTPTPPLSGRRTPRPDPTRVCVRALLGRVGRAGLSGAFWCASPFLLAVLGALFACSAPSERGLPCLWLLLGFFCFPFPSLVAPPLHPALCIFRHLVPWALASCRPPPLSSVRPVVSCFSCFPAPGAWGLGLLLPVSPPAFFFLFLFVPPPLLSPALPAFRLPWAFVPPPPLFFLFFSLLFFLFFLPVVRCGAGLCVFGRRVCPRLPRWCCPCRCSVCAGWCCVVLAVGPGCPVLSPGGSWCRASVVLSLSGLVARRPVVWRGVSWCSAALGCVLLRCAVVWWCAVVLCRLFASLPVHVVCFVPLRVCCVCSGVSRCVFPVLPALCGAVLVPFLCAVRVVRSLLVAGVVGSWCRCLLLRGVVVALVPRRCCLVVCVGFGVRVWSGRRSASSLWCPAPLCCVLWRCAAVWFCAVVPWLFFFGFSPCRWRWFPVVPRWFWAPGRFWVVSVSVLCLCGAVLVCLRRCSLFGALLPSGGWLVFCVVACCVCVFAVGPGCPLLSPDGSWWLLVSCLAGVLWCVPGCCAAPCCCALCRLALRCCVLCCFVVLRLVLPRAVLCPGALSVVLGSCAFWCRVLFCAPALCVFCCGVSLRGVVRRCALCRVRPGVLCCGFFMLYLLQKLLQFRKIFFFFFFSAVWLFLYLKNRCKICGNIFCFCF